MKRSTPFQLALAAMVAAIAVPGHARQPDLEGAQGCTPELVVVNAKVHTVDATRPSAEAVAICGGIILRVGTTSEVRALAGPKTRVIDAQGRLLLPGFNDAHVHLIDGANEVVGVNLRPAKDVKDLARILREHAAKLPKGRWIIGGYWDHEAWPGKALPTRHDIDAATPDHPVFVQRLDGHMGLANSLAMTRARAPLAAKDPDGGTIVRDPAGAPTGVFKDNAMAMIAGAIPADSPDELKEKARAALRLAASLGVTSVQDMTASPAELQAYRELQTRGELSARIYSIQNHGGPAAPPAGDDWIRTGARKLFADGSMGSGTAAFFEPYADDRTTSGLLLQSPEELRAAIFAADAASQQLVVHAIGDRANAIVLDIFERLERQRGRRDRRPRIEHAQVVRDPDKKRFGSIGVIASIQPSHCIDDMRWAERRIGKDRTPISYDFKSFADAGARIAFGTDWYVEPLDPMLGLYAAVTRQFPDGTPAGGWFPEERISMAEAIAYYTLGSAYAEFSERRKGTITEGKLADMVLLSQDLFTIAPADILRTRALLTIAGGRVVHEVAPR